MCSKDIVTKLGFVGELVRENGFWALSGKCLSHKHEALSSTPPPRTHIKRQDVVVHACNLGSGEGDPWGLLASQHSLLSSSRPVRDPVKE